MSMTIRATVLSLSSALFIGAAMAQTPSWPIVNGHELQPTQQEIYSRSGDRARAWDRRVQPEIDRIYQELTRETPAGKR